MKKQKMYRLFCAACWLGTAVSGFLTGYMLHLARRFPTVESFAKNTRLAGVLLLLWLAAAVYFTVRARKEKDEER